MSHTYCRYNGNGSSQMYSVKRWFGVLPQTTFLKTFQCFLNSYQLYGGLALIAFTVLETGSGNENRHVLEPKIWKQAMFSKPHYLKKKSHEPAAGRIMVHCLLKTGDLFLSNGNIKGLLCRYFITIALILQPSQQKARQKNNIANWPFTLEHHTRRPHYSDIE